ARVVNKVDTGNEHTEIGGSGKGPKQLSEVSEGVLKVFHGDMLKIDHSSILQAANMSETDSICSKSRVHLIGNLPFNVASPLLVQWMKMLYGREGIFRFPNVSMTLMFQKEVGNRIVAGVNDSRRGRISVLVQSLCEARTVYQLPSEVFVPKPKVDAVLIQLKSLSNPVLNGKRLSRFRRRWT
ncbi:7116_t:CDS:2, partial [Acaulospora colombiana]